MKEIFIVGMGPGKIQFMSEEAKEVLQKCDVIAGYTLYVDLIRESFPDKEFITTPMRQEIERCRLCFEQALTGKTVALICSGDAGVYGMASPMFELRQENEQFKDIKLKVIPGVTAANSGAALLGAPLNHDYCTISLSDLLTPWETIEKRLIAAVQGDFAIALYNPSSHKRCDYLSRACQILLKAGASGTRACGYVENIGRNETQTTVCTLEELQNRQVNMLTTVFIGNSQTEIYRNCADGDRLVTKRGYSIQRV